MGLTFQAAGEPVESVVTDRRTQTVGLRDWGPVGADFSEHSDAKPVHQRQITSGSPTHDARSVVALPSLRERVGSRPVPRRPAGDLPLLPPAVSIAADGPGRGCGSACIRGTRRRASGDRHVRVGFRAPRACTHNAGTQVGRYSASADGSVWPIWHVLFDRGRRACDDSCYLSIGDLHVWGFAAGYMADMSSLGGLGGCGIVTACMWMHWFPPPPRTGGRAMPSTVPR